MCRRRARPHHARAAAPRTARCRRSSTLLPCARSYPRPPCSATAASIASPPKSASPTSDPTISARIAGWIPESAESFDRARRQMHGIFVGEIQALEGAGRTAFDYTTDETPLQMKLDMARQCWDEARHVEISLRLGEHMGTEIGEYSEAVTLFEAACHARPGLPARRRQPRPRRPCHRCVHDDARLRRRDERSGAVLLRGLDAGRRGDPREDGQHLAARAHQGRQGPPVRALEFQRTVDGLFNFRGSRGEAASTSIRLARKFREMAGFQTEEIDQIAAMAEAQRAAESRDGRRRTDRTRRFAVADYIDLNRANWDDRAPAHAASPDYAFDRFVADPRLPQRGRHVRRPAVGRRARTARRSSAVPHRDRHGLARPPRRGHDRTRLLRRVDRRSATSLGSRRARRSSSWSPNVYDALEVLRRRRLRSGVHGHRRVVLAARRAALGRGRRRPAAPRRTARSSAKAIR